MRTKTIIQSARLAACVEALNALLAGTGQEPATILKLGGRKQRLPNFDIPSKLRARLSWTASAMERRSKATTCTTGLSTTGHTSRC